MSHLHMHATESCHSPHSFSQLNKSNNALLRRFFTRCCMILVSLPMLFAIAPLCLLLHQSRPTHRIDFFISIFSVSSMGVFGLKLAEAVPFNGLCNLYRFGTADGLHQWPCVLAGPMDYINVVVFFADSAVIACDPWNTSTTCRPALQPPYRPVSCSRSAITRSPIRRRPMGALPYRP